MRLIDADEAIINFGFEWDDISPTRDEFVVFLKKQPTIDAVPVVRCEDCKYFGTNDENVPYCLNPFGLDDPEPNGFCNYGRVKDAIEAWHLRTGEEAKHGIATD